MNAEALTAVVVLSFDKKDETLRCLESLSALRYEPLEIVAVDNGSSDGSPDAITERFPGVHLVRNPTNAGPAAGRNRGFEWVNRRFAPRYVFFVDNDTTFDPDVVHHLANALEADPGAAIACPKAYQRHPSTTLFSAGAHVDFAKASVYDIGCGEEDRGQFDVPRRVTACGSFGMLVRCEALKELGGWDERFDPYGWEDIDLCLRARGRGLATVYEPRAIMYHAGGLVGRGIVPTYEAYKVVHYAVLAAKHATVGEHVRSAFWIPIRAAKLMLRFARDGWMRAMASQPGTPDPPPAR